MVYQPEEIVNRYIWHQFKIYAPEFCKPYVQVSGGPEIIPFFPAPPTNVPAWILDQNLSHIVFDKFTRVRGPYRELYPIKTDQMRYSIVGGAIGGENYGYPYLQEDRYANTIKLTSLIYKILDREDAAAQDINNFANTLPGYSESNPMFKYFFHCFNAYQSGFTENQGDVENFMDHNAKRDLLVKYDYHSVQFNES